MIDLIDKPLERTPILSGIRRYVTYPVSYLFREELIPAKVSGMDARRILRWTPRSLHRRTGLMSCRAFA